MPFYHKLENIPHKRHTVFKKPDGGYYYEELFEQSVLMECPLCYTMSSTNTGKRSVRVD